MAPIDEWRCVFFDTAPIIYYVEHNPSYHSTVETIFGRVIGGLLPAVSSPVTLAECLVGPLRRSAQCDQDLFVEVLTSSTGLTLRTIDSRIGRSAAELRARYNFALMDALQLATALESGCDVFLTNDARLRRVTELDVVTVDELFADMSAADESEKQ